MGPRLIRTSLTNISDGDTVTVNVIGSKGIILRAGKNEVVYTDPDVVPETETTEPENTESTESTENTEDTENTENSESSSSAIVPVQ